MVCFLRFTCKLGFRIVGCDRREAAAYGNFASSLVFFKLAPRNFNLGPSAMLSNPKSSVALMGNTLRCAERLKNMQGIGNGR